MDFESYLKHRQAHIYAELKTLLKTHSSASNTLNKSLEYSVLSNGKFLRPLLVKMNNLAAIFISLGNAPVDPKISFDYKYVELYKNVRGMNHSMIF